MTDANTSTAVPPECFDERERKLGDFPVPVIVVEGSRGIKVLSVIPARPLGSPNAYAGFLLHEFAGGGERARVTEYRAGSPGMELIEAIMREAGARALIGYQELCDIQSGGLLGPELWDPAYDALSFAIGRLSREG